MVKRRFSTVLAAGLIFVALLLVILLRPTPFGLMGLQPATGQSAAATPQQLYLPAVQQDQPQPTASPTELPTTDGMSLPPGWRDTDPNNITDEVEPLEPEPFNTPLPYTPVPTPNVDVKTIPALDEITLTNFRELRLPSKFPSFYGQVAWSPGSKQFVGLYDGTMDGVGLNVYQLYKGRVETGEFALWTKNGNWPTWSQDGQFVYYLAPRQDGSRFSVAENLSRPYYDFFRRSIDSDTEELLLKDVEPPGVPIPQIAEITTGEILKFTPEYQLALLPPAAELVQTTAQGRFTSPLAELTARLKGNGSIYSFLPPSFSVSPNGKLAVVISVDKGAFLLDLVTHTQVATIENGPDTAVNVKWHPNSEKIAYINGQGLFVYDIPASATRTVFLTQVLGFHPDDPWSGIALPNWLANEQVILFEALSPAWVQPGTPGEERKDTFILAATIDGNHWRAVGHYALESVAPNGRHAIIRQRNPTDHSVGLFLVDLTD